MGTESGPLNKRFRSSLGSNVQITECIREFKLPRQYPSMVPKSQNHNATIDKAKGQTLTTTVSSVPQVSIISKNLQSNKLPVAKVRTVKLKAKDGRDLGEVKVRDLAQNTQGKTINITENVIKKPPEIVPVIDKTKGVTIGVLTPVNILKSDRFVHSYQETLCSDNITGKKNNTKDILHPLELPNVSATVNTQGRPQVLVIQSGKSWHMVKIPNALSTETTNKSTNNCTTVKSQQLVNCGKVTISGIQTFKDQQSQNNTSGGNINGGLDRSVGPAKNVYTESNQSQAMTKKLPQLIGPDNTIERSKQKSLPIAESSETGRPKIEISQIVAPPENKSAANVQSARNATDNGKPVGQSDVSLLKKLQLRQDVMVILPPEEEARDADADNSPKNKTESMKNSDASRKKTSSSSAISEPCILGSAWRRKMLANKHNDGTRYSSTRDLTSSSRRDKKDEMENNLIILEKALSSVEDEVLRKRALKALAECGIGMERFVPVRPASEQRSVKDSDTQTSIFGLWDTDKFIHVPKDRPTLERIPIVERTPDESPNVQFINPNSEGLFMSSMEWPSRVDKECIELTNMVEGFVKGNDTANQVAAIFAKPCPVRVGIIEQLQNDFDNCKNYDNDGLLNIHKAVIMEHVQAVRRHLMVLRACDESPDVPTRDGRTSLELAISHDVSPEIVKILLDAGAEPTCMDTGHDSALIIASKKSSPMLMELIRYVKSYRSLNHYDSTGFAALHYCAQNGYQEGVTALVRALADVDLRDRRSGRTALFHAIENEFNDLAELLLENNAIPSISNYGGQTIFNILDDVKHYNLLEILNRNAK